MKNVKPIDSVLWKAYEQTDFIVHSAPEFVLNIGQFSDQLIQLFSINKVTTAAFVTAYNPFSKKLSRDENSVQQSNFVKEVQSRGLSFL